MIEEDFLGVGCVRWDIAITRLGIIRVFGLVPLNGWAGNISFLVELRSLHPTFRYRVVAQLPDDCVVAINGVVGIGRCTLHRRNTRRCAERLVVFLALLLYLHHTGGIVFLTGRDVIAAGSVNIAELAYTELTCHMFVADSCHCCFF